MRVLILFQWLLDAKISGGRQLVVTYIQYDRVLPHDVIGRCIRDLRVPHDTIGLYIRDLEGTYCPGFSSLGSSSQPT